MFLLCRLRAVVILSPDCTRSINDTWWTYRGLEGMQTEKEGGKEKLTGQTGEGEQISR